MEGSPLNVGLLRVDLFEKYYKMTDGRLTVLWSSEETNEAAAGIAKKLKIKPLHISTSPDNQAICLNELTPESINQHVKDLAVAISGADDEYKEFRSLFTSAPTVIRNAGSLSFQPLMHNCTAPLVRVLEASGYSVDTSKGIPPQPNNNVHIEEILMLVEQIDVLRSQIKGRSSDEKNDVIVFCPSMCSYLYDTSSFEWNQVYRKLDKDRRTFLRDIIRNKGYSNSSIKLSKGFKNPYDDEILGPFLVQRQFELRAFAEFVAIVAVNQFAPPIRLPHGVMLHHAQLKNIYALIKSADAKSRSQLTSRVAAYSSDLKKDIGERLLNAILTGRQKILAMCDFPIEWISIDGLPIMFSHEISRIPSTPGDLFGQTALAGERVMLPLEELSNILVIRSFADEDPIRKHTESAIASFNRKNELENLTIKIVDVQTIAEVEHALNEFTGAIVIFDCHGDHGGEESHAWLHIGKEKLDVWNLANRTRVPPIAILSACSTHAIDGSHASVANGLIRSGAVSVIGTYAPVNSIHASTVVGRLLYRIAAFLPLVLKQGFMSWRTVVSGFFRMSYVSDVLKEFSRLGLISESQFYSLHLAGNMSINNFDPAWHSNFLAALQTSSDLSAEKFKSLMESDFQFVDTMIWVQLGRPENILISLAENGISTTGSNVSRVPFPESPT